MIGRARFPCRRGAPTPTRRLPHRRPGELTPAGFVRMIACMRRRSIIEDAGQSDIQGNRIVVKPGEQSGDA